MEKKISKIECHSHVTLFITTGDKNTLTGYIDVTFVFVRSLSVPPARVLLSLLVGYLHANHLVKVQCFVLTIILCFGIFRLSVCFNFQKSILFHFLKKNVIESKFWREFLYLNFFFISSIEVVHQKLTLFQTIFYLFLG